MAGNVSVPAMRLISLWLMIVCLTAWARQPRAVWIDTDPSVAPGGHEIDDGLALLQAFHSPEIAIRGVSIVFGNAGLADADRIGRYIVGQFGPHNLAVYTGASKPQEGETDASRALESALRREPLTILALGPATNIATVLRLHPRLAGRIEEVVAVAGRRAGQQFTAGPASRQPLRDFNFEMDPQAFQVLLDSKVKLTFGPWEISSKVWLTRDELETLALKSPGIAWLLPAALDWLRLWKTQFGADGFNPFDTLAVGYLVDPGTLTCRALKMSIETTDKPYLVVRESDRGRVVNYCHTPSPEFTIRLLDRLATVPAPSSKLSRPTVDSRSFWHP